MIRLFYAYSPKRRLWLAVSEFLLILLALFAAAFIALGDKAGVLLGQGHEFLKIALVWAVCLMCLYHFDVYHLTVLANSRELLVRLLQVLGSACIILAVLYYTYPAAGLGGISVFVVGTVLVGLFLAGWRRLFVAPDRSSDSADWEPVLDEDPPAASSTRVEAGQAYKRLASLVFSPLGLLLVLTVMGLTRLRDEFRLIAVAILADPERPIIFVFWGCLLLVTYTYLLYPLLLFVAYSLSQVRRDWHYLTSRSNRRVTPLAPEDLPAVSLIVPARNEQACLPAKIVNVRELDYPQDRLEVVFVSDGSTDRTNEILRTLEAPSIECVFLSARKGKSTAVSHGVQRARNDVLVFSDASTLFEPDALKNLVRHFSDPRVGVVCGSLKFRRTLESAQTEGVYWRYESLLRLMETRLGATLTASGAIYALRRRCFRRVASFSVIEDFLIPMNARKLGYRVVYDPEAVATEFAASSVEGEFARRVRLAVGSFRALGEFARIPLRGYSWVAFLSHKLLRWFVPFFLIGLLVSNALLLNHPLYRVAFVGQLLFYVWAAAGFLFRDRLQRVRYGLVGYFLLSMNLAFLVGFIRFLFGREVGTWQRVN